MTMAKSNVSAIFIGIGDERIELSGKELEAFVTDRDARAQEASLLEAEYQAKQDARESAIKKLADIAGLTKEELASIL
jgi:hypothetical protein